MDVINVASGLFYGLLDLGVTIVWTMILFHIGTLLQRNKEVLAYFNILGTDAAEHLIDGSSPSSFNPSTVISTIGTLLKIYAIASVVIEFLSMFRYMF